MKTTRKKSNKDIALAIKRMGGPVAAAEVTGAPSYQSVQSWIRSGQVPVQYCLKVEEHGGVSRSLLRPKDYLRIWPELAEAA